MITNECSCEPSCRERTTRVFAPGHDARLVGLLAQAVADGRLSAEQARLEGLARGASPLLQLKIVRAVGRAAERRRHRQA